MVSAVIKATFVDSNKTFISSKDIKERNRTVKAKFENKNLSSLLVSFQILWVKAMIISRKLINTTHSCTNIFYVHGVLSVCVCVCVCVCVLSLIHI